MGGFCPPYAVEFPLSMSALIELNMQTKWKRHDWIEISHICCKKGIPYFRFLFGTSQFLIIGQKCTGPICLDKSRYVLIYQNIDSTCHDKCINKFFWNWISVQQIQKLISRWNLCRFIKTNNWQCKNFSKSSIFRNQTRARVYQSNYLVREISQYLLQLSFK